MAMIANLSKALADQHVEIGRLRAEIERLQALLRGTGANRYWEGRWRDEVARIERLRAVKTKMVCEGCRRLAEVADENERLEARIERLEAVADAARAMPRTTPKPGGAYTKHDYQIEASHVWALDRALVALALARKEGP